MKTATAVALALIAAIGTTIGDAVTPPPLPTYTCHRVHSPVKVDGKLEEPAWRQAALFTDLRLNDGVTRPTAGTEFRAMWDSRNLYLSFVCQDPEIIATVTKRDSGLYDEDCVEVFLSTGGDLRRYFEFELSPRNVQMDASVFPTPDGTDKVVDYGWNCNGLQTATRRDGTGQNQRWTIEIAIPFSRIGRDRKPPVAGQTWRANFYRIDYSPRPTEYICWSPMYGEANFHARERFGKLVFAEK